VASAWNTQNSLPLLSRAESMMRTWDECGEGCSVADNAQIEQHLTSYTSNVTRHRPCLIICQKALVIGVVDSDNLCRSCVFNIKEKVTYTNDEACLAAIPLGRQPVTT
jgi:hypothetical protein